jgi:hypothetical protein
VNADERRQIAASYCILLLLLAVVAAALVMPAFTARADRLTGIQTAREIYQRSNTAIAEAEAILTAGDWAIDEQTLLQADTDALAAAALQQMISGIVDTADAELISMAHRRSEKTLPLIEVPVAVRLTASVAGLTQIFLAIEQSRPVLFVSEVAIQSRHRPGGQLQTLQEELDVQFDVTGFLMPREAPL